MGVAAELIADLRSEAERVDDGTFTVDPLAARRKLEEFRYANRDAYLAHLVEGMCVLGATDVSIETERADLIVETDAVALSNAVVGLRELFAAIFAADGTARAFALGRLGIGVDMALGHDDIENVALEFGDGNVTVVGIYERGAEAPFVGRVEPRPSRARVIIDRSDEADRTERRDARARPDLWKLRKAARFTPRRITVRGESISPGVPQLQIARMLQAERFRGSVGFHRDYERPTLHVLSGGMLADAIPQPQWRPYTVAFVEVDNPTRDLSQSAIARDAVYDGILAAIGAEEQGQLHELWMKWRLWRKHGYPRGFGWKCVRAALNTDGRFDDHPG